MLGRVNGPPPNWERVGEAVRERMDKIRPRLRQADLVRITGLSDPTIRGVMRGNPRGEPDDYTRKRICDALGWRDDSIDRLLAGDEPIVVASPAVSPSVVRSAGLDLRVDALEAQVEALVQALQVVVRLTTRDASSERIALEQLLALLPPVEDGRAHPPVL